MSGQEAGRETLTFRSAMRYLFSFAKNDKKHFVLFYIGWLIENLLSIATTILTGVLINSVVYYHDLNTFFRISIVLAFMVLFNSGVYFYIYGQHLLIRFRYANKVRMRAYGHFLKAQAAQLDNVNTGDMVNLLEEYTEEFMNFLVRQGIHRINGIISIALMLFYTFVISWEVGLLMLVIVPLTVLLSTKFGGKVRVLAADRRREYDSFTSWVFEMLGSIRDLRLLGAEQKVNRRFTEDNRRLMDIEVRTGFTTFTFENAISLVNLAVQMLIFTLAAWLASRGGMTVGMLLVLLTFFGYLTTRVKMLSNNVLDGHQKLAVLQQVYDFLHSPTEDSWPGTAELEVREGGIRFREVDFAYDDRKPVLDGFSLDIAPGERLALVGKSGCGKSTLAYMLLGFYGPSRGYVEIDGQRLDRCTLKSIRRQIGLVSQDVRLFTGTIRENLLLGNRGAAEGELREACRRAGILDFIDTLPEGLDTVLEKGGANLSGGQRQRLSIARIYLKNPSILIFDEATSSLDAATEEQIHEAWKEVLSTRTAIIIAHRQSSVMLCDRVAVMDGGRLLETGTPEEMEADSAYFQMLFATVEEEGA